MLCISSPATYLAPVLLHRKTTLTLFTTPHTYPVPLQLVVDSHRIRRYERVDLFLRGTPMQEFANELRRIHLLETVWKLKISSLLGSHECSKRGPEALICRLGGHQIHTLLSLLAIFQTVSLEGSTLAIWPRNTPRRLGVLQPPRDFFRVGLPQRHAKSRSAKRTYSWSEGSL